MKKLIPLILILFMSNFGYSQESKKIIYDFTQEVEYYNEQKNDTTSNICITKIADDLEYQELERKISLSEKNGYAKSDEIFTIPVVVHIIHDGDAYGTGSNIDDEQVWSAIQGMNEDYRKYPGTLGDGAGADVGVEFCLATIDPDGNPTSGINRVNGCSIADYCSEGITAGEGQGANELNVKNLSRWPNQDYYNIWVVIAIENNGGGSGIQGYAYFPTTSPVDGTVLLYNAFGTEGNLKSYTNRNRTLTHELGHAFALFHTFQGGSCSESNCNIQGDRVCDTPPTTLNSSCSAPACFGTQQVENYMDYTSQTCKDMFSEGQAERMRNSIMNSRINLINSNKCGTYTETIDMEVVIVSPESGACAGPGEVILEIENTGTEIIYNTDINVNLSATSLSFDWVGPLGPGQSAILQFEDVEFTVDDTEFIVDIVDINDYPVSGFSITKDLFISDQSAGRVEFTLDVLGGQNTWEIRNTATDEVIRSEGPFPNFNNGVTYIYDLCLLDGCYDITIFDAVNNGVCCFNGDGAFRIFDTEDNLVFEATVFQSEATYSFCVENNPLPVEFLGMTANCVDDNIELEWSTGSELNNDFFTLYRRTQYQAFNGISISSPFIEIGTIMGTGNSSVQSDYSFIDDNIHPNTLTNYYKLVQTDFNGDSEELITISKICKRELRRCNWILSNNRILSNSKVDLYSSFGMPVKNKSLSDGIYILSVGDNCIYRIAIQNSKIVGSKEYNKK